jgi:hypothetical protein
MRPLPDGSRLSGKYLPFVDYFFSKVFLKNCSPPITMMGRMVAFFSPMEDLFLSREEFCVPEKKFRFINRKTSKKNIPAP